MVRIAIALVFLWFGISQIADPESFLGYVPEWLYQQEPQMMMHGFMQFIQKAPNFVYTIILLNGIFETIFGALLLVGYFTRIVAFLLALHLFGIAFSLGYNDIAVRDFGLALATLSLIFSGAGEFSLDKRLEKTFNRSV